MLMSRGVGRKLIILPSFVLLLARLPLAVLSFSPSLLPPRHQIRLARNVNGGKARDIHLFNGGDGYRHGPCGGGEEDYIRTLFAWITRAIAGDERYDSTDLALDAIFGDLPPDSEPARMAKEALDSLAAEEDVPRGMTSLTQEEREANSLGPLGAGQWTGQRAEEESLPHSLLDVRNLTDVSDWERTLPRTCRQNLRKAAAANVTVGVRPIVGDGVPAPHSTLAHFRCIAEHETRIRTKARPDEPSGAYFGGLCEAVGRYVGTIRMAGTIYEYRRGGGGGDDGDSNEDVGRIVAFLHEVRKGRVLRGQWCYLTDEASHDYVWFRTVRDLVRRAIEEEGVDVVDLGPSGSDGRLDSHEKLKGRYGFELVEDWPSVADYRGPFW